MVGHSIFDILERIAPGGLPEAAKDYRSIFDGTSDFLERFSEIGGESYRTLYMVDVYDTTDNQGNIYQARGAIVTCVNVTDKKVREALEVENTRLEIDERLAQDASRQKSTFLANVWPGIHRAVCMLSNGRCHMKSAPLCQA